MRKKKTVKMCESPSPIESKWLTLPTKEYRALLKALRKIWANAEIAIKDAPDKKKVISGFKREKK